MGIIFQWMSNLLHNKNIVKGGPTGKKPILVRSFEIMNHTLQPIGKNFRNFMVDIAKKDGPGISDMISTLFLGDQHNVSLTPILRDCGSLKKHICQQ